MELNLQKPLLFFDIESTGLNIASDGIIELSFVKVFPGGKTEVKTWKIKPWDYVNHRVIKINPEASAVNGVKDEDLVNCPKFIAVLPEVAQWLSGSDLAGFNSIKFDLPMLAEEIDRVRHYCNQRLSELAPDSPEADKARETLKIVESIDLHSARMVDVQNIFHHFEPRNLRAAYRFYCGGKDFENAHTAEADTVATMEVLKSQLDRYAQPDDFREEVLKNDVEYLSGIGGPRNKALDFAGRLIEGADGEAVISFGKHRGRKAREIWEEEPSYFSWIENGDFTLDTKEVFSRLKEKYIREKKQALNRPATPGELASLAEKFKPGKLF